MSDSLTPPSGRGNVREDNNSDQMARAAGIPSSGGGVGRVRVMGASMADQEVIRCRAPARRPRYDGELCNGFVAKVPFPVRVCGLPRHSDRADDAHLVVPCSNCGTLHEMIPEPEPAAAGGS